MALEKYTSEQHKKMSMIQLARLLMLNEKKPQHFKDIYQKICEIKDFDDAQKKEKISQFYTELNMDGSFITNGSNEWGLRQWYINDQRLEQKEEIEDDEEELEEF